mgnify:CR=1 FL=1
MAETSRQRDLNLLIGGEAGQGLLTVGQLLARAMVRAGYSAVVTQDYMSRIRGGHNTFTIRASDRKLHAPREKLDLLVALTAETLEYHRHELSPTSLVVAEKRFNLEGPGIISPPISELAELRYHNIAMCGVIGNLIGLDRETLTDMARELFGSKKPEDLEKNLAAFSRAWEWTAGSGSHDFLKLPPAPGGGRRLYLQAHDALALGALSAGLKFYSFYPMTPGTSLANALAHYQSTLPIVVEQAEDEIAAINMALGASFAGAPAMVGTSGGGFALMVEGVSLAGMTETPIVIVISQRPGPATGLPTRTEQADLEFVLHSGHGEFPRAIFAPGSPEQAFDLARRALFLAEDSQGPVFILTDQYLADTCREVEPFKLDGLPRVEPGGKHDGAAGEYRRFKVTTDGVSPRLIPGKSEALVVADSDEHTEDGHITESAEVRTAMVKKRGRKLELIRSRVLTPEFGGSDDPDLLLVCWGSTLGPAAEAVELLGRRGTKAGWLHFSQVWPLVKKQFLPRLQKARRVVAVEGNFTGQFARLIRRETGFETSEKILRYDGRPVTPEFILRGLEHGGKP